LRQLTSALGTAPTHTRGWRAAHRSRRGRGRRSAGSRAQKKGAALPSVVEARGACAVPFNRSNRRVTAPASPPCFRNNLVGRTGGNTHDLSAMGGARRARREQPRRKRSVPSRGKRCRAKRRRGGPSGVHGPRGRPAVPGAGPVVHRAVAQASSNGHVGNERPRSDDTTGGSSPRGTGGFAPGTPDRFETARRTRGRSARCRWTTSDSPTRPDLPNAPQQLEAPRRGFAGVTIAEHPFPGSSGPSWTSTAVSMPGIALWA